MVSHGYGLFNGAVNPLFWTIRIPDNALSFGHGGKVRLRAVNVPVVDDFTLFGGAGIGARVSFDVTYTPVGKVRHLRPMSSDPTDPHSFKGELRFATSEGTFAGSNALGFSFVATATNDTPDFPGLVFGEMGTERNGFFLR